MGILWRWGRRQFNNFWAATFQEWINKGIGITILMSFNMEDGVHCTKWNTASMLWLFQYGLIFSVMTTANFCSTKKVFVEVSVKDCNASKEMLRKMTWSNSWWGFVISKRMIDLSYVYVVCFQCFWQLYWLKPTKKHPFN